MPKMQKMVAWANVCMLVAVALLIFPGPKKATKDKEEEGQPLQDVAKEDVNTQLGLTVEVSDRDEEET